MVMGFCCCAYRFSSSFPVTRDLHPFGVWLGSVLWSEGMKWVEACLLIWQLNPLICIFKISILQVEN